jgi:hypothetical protein
MTRNWTTPVNNSSRKEDWEGSYSLISLLISNSSSIPEGWTMLARPIHLKFQSSSLHYFTKRGITRKLYYRSIEESLLQRIVSQCMNLMPNLSLQSTRSMTGIPTDLLSHHSVSLLPLPLQRSLLRREELLSSTCRSRLLTSQLVPPQ